MILRNNSIDLPQKTPDRPLINTQEGLVSTDSAQFDSECVPTTVAQPNSHFSKVFDQPLNAKALKKIYVLASQHCSISELFFLTA